MGRHRDPGHTTDSGQAPLKVSVVVPVYNPGRAIEPCIASVLGQSLPRHDYEVLFVDDGSTDETPARLDELVAREPNVRVIHIPNSGWPGRPRNVGIEAARGDYVQFLDNDDALGAEALERLYAIGRRNDADIVIGKVAGNFAATTASASHALRGVPYVLFKRTRESCTIRDAPLIDSLTPHKMFRTAFLREHQIRFPEDRGTLEDQLFVVPAYFAASVVSVLADYVCYLYRERADGRNAGSARIDPATYYGSLRSVLDIVIANTEPGDFRDRLLRRFFRVEMLGRLSEPMLPDAEPQFRVEVFEAIRELALALVPETVDAGLRGVMRLRARLLRAGDLGALVRLAERCAAIRAAVTVDDIRWTEGSVRVDCRAQYETDRGPLTIIRRADREVIDVSPTDDGGDEPIDVTGEVALTADVFVRDSITGAQWPVPTKRPAGEKGATVRPDGSGDRESRDALEPALAVRATADPMTLAGGRPLSDGTWELWLRLTGLGLDRQIRIGDGVTPLVPAPGLAALPALLGDPPLHAIAHFRAAGVALDVGRAARLGPVLAATRLAFLTHGRVLRLRLPIVTTRRTGGSVATLVLRHGTREATIPARIEPSRGRILLVADARELGPRLPRGKYELLGRLDGDDGPEVRLADVRVGLLRRVTVIGAGRPSRVAGVRRTAARLARALARPLPARLRDRFRRIARRSSRPARNAMSAEPGR